MVTNDKYKLMDVVGQHVLACRPDIGQKENTMYTLNDTAAFLWKNIEGKNFDLQSLASLLTNEYGISTEEADNDARCILSEWCNAGLCLNK